MSSMNTDIKLSDPNRKTIVIFGVSSFLGSNLAQFFKDDFKVIGTFNKNPVRIPGVLSLPCDVLSKDEVSLILYAFKPDYAIYCAGLSSIVECHKDEDRADALNTSGLFNVAEYCQRYKSQVCYVSSSFIFAGEKRNYYEMDIPDSMSVYGKTQAAAEFYLQKTSLNYLIFRTCRLYGRSLVATRPNWFQNFQRKIILNQNLNMDSYIHTGYLDVYYLAMVMKMTFAEDVSNRLFQVGSRDIGSMHDFAKNYAEIFGISKDRVSKDRWPYPVKSSQSSMQMDDNLYFKMDTTNVEAFLNIELPTIKDSLEFTFKRFEGVKEKSRSSSSNEGVKFI